MIKYMNIIPDYDTGTVKVKLYTDKKQPKPNTRSTTAAGSYAPI
jgi:hypothetical protein